LGYINFFLTQFKRKGIIFLWDLLLRINSEIKVEHIFMQICWIDSMVSPVLNTF
jgi:hypothetical protein